MKIVYLMKDKINHNKSNSMIPSTRHGLQDKLPDDWFIIDPKYDNNLFKYFLGLCGYLKSMKVEIKWKFELIIIYKYYNLFNLITLTFNEPELLTV